MSSSVVGCSIVAVLLGMSTGCGKGTPVGPPPLPGPPTSIAAVSPSAGSTGGSTLVTITGTGFQSGATVRIDGTDPSTVPVTIRDTTTILFLSPPHKEGTVDVVVTNPGGRAATLSGGFTYASPLSFDFNGDWAGVAGPELDTVMRFTVENNVLTRVSCGPSGTFSFSPAPAVGNGEFSFFGGDGVGASGRIVAGSDAIGSINIPPCTNTVWRATKSQRAQGASSR